jgi:Holliday junction resolvase RusA-like endonuclease
MAAGEIAHTSRPDLDNCQKAIEDAMNGIAYVDDVQIVHGVQEKLYAEIPGVDVVLLAWAPRVAT